MVMTILFDIGPPGGAIGLAAAAGFLLIAIAVAYIVFRMLRKTVKMALRLAVVAVILIVGFVGTLAFLYMGTSGSGPKGKPAPTRQR